MRSLTSILLTAQMTTLFLKKTKTTLAFMSMTERKPVRFLSVAAPRSSGFEETAPLTGVVYD